MGKSLHNIVPFSRYSSGALLTFAEFYPMTHLLVPGELLLFSGRIVLQIHPNSLDYQQRVEEASSGQHCDLMDSLCILKNFAGSIGCLYGI